MAPFSLLVCFSAGAVVAAIALIDVYPPSEADEIVPHLLRMLCNMSELALKFYNRKFS